MPENEARDLSPALQDTPPQNQEATENVKKPVTTPKKPTWAILALALIALSVILLLLLANIQLRVQQRTHLFEKDLTPVKLSTSNGEAWGYLDETGLLAISAMYEEALPFAPNGLAAVKKDGAWGYINTQGETVIACTLEDTLGFDDDALAPAKLYGLWGYIDNRGTFAIPPQFDSAHHFANCGLALIGIDKQCGYITRTGEYAVLPQYTAAYDFDQDGYAAVFALGKWGLINKNGEFAINPRFEEIGSFSESGVAPVKFNGKYGYIDHDGKYVLPPSLFYAEEFSAGLAVVQPEENGPFGYVDEDGQIVIPARYDKALPFAENGLAAVAVSAKLSDSLTTDLWGYINEQGEFVIRPELEYASTFSMGLAAVYQNGAYVYINEQGEEIFKTPDDCLMAGRFTDDGYAILFCKDPNKETLLYDYVSIVDVTGKTLHAEKLLSLTPELLKYAVTP